MDLHEFRARPIQSLRFEDVVRFCETQERENVVLDYKQEISSKSPAKQIAKLVAAFANTQGGIVIWGVKESDKDGIPCKDQVGMVLGSDPKKTISDVCRTQVFPPPQVEVSEFLSNLSDPTRGFLVARVLPGKLVPYTFDGVIYVRVNDSSDPVPADLATVRYLLDRRKPFEDAQTQRRSAMVSRLEPLCGEYPSFWITVGPTFEADRNSPVAKIQALLEESAKKSKSLTRFLQSANTHPVHEGLVVQGTNHYVSWLTGDDNGNVAFLEPDFSGKLFTHLAYLKGKTGLSRCLVRHLGSSDFDSRVWGRMRAMKLEPVEHRFGILQDFARLVDAALRFSVAYAMKLDATGHIDICIRLQNVKGLPFTRNRSHPNLEPEILSSCFDNEVFIRTVHLSGANVTQTSDCLWQDLLWSIGIGSGQRDSLKQEIEWGLHETIEVERAEYYR